MGQGILLFDTNSPVSASQAYLQDAFNDIALPATNNTNLTSTVSTNPLNGYFGNDNVPRYAAKTLFIKDLILIDKTKWVNDKPTYQVIWNEDFPAAQAYVYGTISLTSTTQGNRVDLTHVGDGFGVTGVIQRTAWIVETSTAATATAQQYLDNVATTTIDFSGGATGWDGQPKYNVYVNAASNSSLNLHDYRLVALQNSTLSVTGVIVYYEVTGLGINCFGGNSYINKQQVVTTGSTLSVPAVTAVRGGRASIYKTLQATYGVTVSPIADVVSTATGTNATNLLNVTTGTGASFPRGTAVYVAQGTSLYVGNILSQSTDTLTMGVTLPFGISQSIYQLFQAGHTAFPIGSTYLQKFEFNPSLYLQGSTTNVQPVFGFNDPNLEYRVWGGSLLVGGYSTIWGSTASIFPGLGSSLLLDLSSTNSFLQIDGNFQALEFEFAAGISAQVSATLSIDGMAMYNFNDNMAGASGGFFRKSIMTNAGPGFHSVNLSRAAGWTQVAISRITGYQSQVLNGPSFGVLGQLDFGQTFLPVSGPSASNSSLGNIKRIFADSLGFKGTWTRGVSASFAGGVAFHGGSNSVSSSVLNFQYYGSAFALIGAIGASNTLSIDGVGSSALANTWLGLGLSNTFHSVVVTGSGHTVRIEAVDFVRPQGQIKWVNSFSTPANSQFFEMINGQLSLKKNAITAREISPFSVGTTALIDGQVTDRKRAARNIQVSANLDGFSTTSTSYVPVTGSDCVITTTGKPVRLFLRNYQNNVGNISMQGSGGAAPVIFLVFARDSIGYGFQNAGFNTANGLIYSPPSAFMYIDDNLGAGLPAGTYTYTVLVKTNAATTTVGFAQCQLVAEEM